MSRWMRCDFKYSQSTNCIAWFGTQLSGCLLDREFKKKKLQNCVSTALVSYSHSHSLRQSSCKYFSSGNTTVLLSSVSIFSSVAESWKSKPTCWILPHQHTSVWYVHISNHKYWSMSLHEWPWDVCTKQDVLDDLSWTRGKKLKKMAPNDKLATRLNENTIKP